MAEKQRLIQRPDVIAPHLTVHVNDLYTIDVDLLFLTLYLSAQDSSFIDDLRDVR